MSRDAEDARATKFLDGVKDTLTTRAGAYPPYSQEAERVAAVWSTIKPRAALSAHDVAELMLVVKMVRYSAGNSPDSLVDLVGYAARLEGMG